MQELGAYLGREEVAAEERLQEARDLAGRETQSRPSPALKNILDLGHVDGVKSPCFREHRIVRREVPASEDPVLAAHSEIRALEAGADTQSVVSARRAGSNLPSLSSTSAPRAR